MNIQLNSKQQIAEAFKQLEANANGMANSPFHEARKKAMAEFEQAEFPTNKHEEWKYTNVKSFLAKDFAFGKVGEVTAELVSKHSFGALEADVLVFVNGNFNSQFSKVSANVAGITISNLKDAYKTHSEDINKHFGKLAKVEGETFTALNTSFAQDGAFIKVEKSKIIEKPVLVLFFSDTKSANSFSQPRNLIIAEENSQLSVIENFITLGEQESLTNIVTEIVVEKRAIVNHYKIQGEAQSDFHVGTTQVLQRENSNFSNTTITMGGGIIRNNLNIEMDGEHIESYMNGLFMLNGKSHVDNHTYVNHKKPNGYSNELYKGILDDNATGVFNGKIFVREDAQKTNAFQTNNNIVLSDKATIDTKPQLEIWADDVKCSHGATVGALDEEPLFYLRSRGIPKNKARALLMFAFATDLLDRIKIEPLRNHIEGLISERLGYEE